MTLALVLLVLAADGGAPAVTGSLSKDQIRTVIRASAIDPARSCARSEATDAGIPSGKLTVHFTISPSGDVSEAAIKDSTFANPRLEACVRDVISKLKFPAPTGGGVVQVNYPFVFTEEPAREKGVLGAIASLGENPFGRDAAPGEGLVVMGGLTGENVKQVMHRRAVDVMDCAEDHRRGDGGLPGTGALVIKFTIDAAGKVTSSRLVSSTSGSAGFDECVRALVTTVQFPPPEGGVLTVVTFPFQLTNWTGDTRGITGIGTTSVKLKSDEAWVRGGLELDTVKRVVLASAARVRSCAPADVRGTVAIHFIVDSNGKVDETTVLRSTVADKAIEACVARAVRAMKFPPPEGGGVALAVYPFSFEPASAPRK
jgi:TonB family protein